MFNCNIILIFLVCVITRLRDSAAQSDVNSESRIDDKKSIDDSLEHWKGKWMPSRPGEYTAPAKVFHKNNKSKESSVEKTWKINEEDEWKGRWMPSRPGEYKPPAKVFHKSNNNNAATKHVFYASISNKNNTCDDGFNNLAVDWDGSATSYTCFGHKNFPDFNVNAEYYCETIPKNYKVMHKCISETISYVEDVPTFGTSRPVWPVYGEYQYMPVQRWLRTLERGAVVMLYHPCANTLQVEGLKELLRRCVRRHVISANNYVDEVRPLVLLTWGCKLSMSYVDDDVVKQFIRENTLHVPEDYLQGGQYVDQLIRKAEFQTEDKQFCS